MKMLGQLLQLSPPEIKALIVEALKLQPKLCQPVLETFVLRPRTTDLVALIGQIVAQVRGVTLDELHGRPRTKEVAESRFIIWHLARQYGRYGYSELGRRFGNRDHGSVFNGCRRARALLESKDATFTRDYRTVEIELNRVMNKKGWLDSMRPAVAIAPAGRVAA